jgi:hypothetical protein
MPPFPIIAALAATRPPAPRRGARRRALPCSTASSTTRAWSAAPESDGFTQKSPDGGKAPGERTIVRILYDEQNVYVGIDCIQRKSPVVARLTRRDRPSRPTR